MLPALGGDHIVAGRPTAIYLENAKLEAHSRAEKRAITPPLITPIAHLSVRFGSLPFHMHMKSFTLARAWCLFSIQELNWRHNLMHRSLQFVHCSCHLLFFICPDCSKHIPCAIFANFLRHHRPIAPPHPRTIAQKTRPGGMRGAIESAALAVWQELACRIQTTSP